MFWSLEHSNLLNFHFPFFTERGVKSILYCREGNSCSIPLMYLGLCISTSMAFPVLCGFLCFAVPQRRGGDGRRTARPAGGGTAVAGGAVKRRLSTRRSLRSGGSMAEATGEGSQKRCFLGFKGFKVWIFRYCNFGGVFFEQFVTP